MALPYVFRATTIPGVTWAELEVRAQAGLRPLRLDPQGIKGALTRTPSCRQDQPGRCWKRKAG